MMKTIRSDVNTSKQEFHQRLAVYHLLQLFGNQEPIFKTNLNALIKCLSQSPAMVFRILTWLKLKQEL